VDLIERERKVPLEKLGMAQQGQIRLRQELNDLMDEYGLDLWISPPAVGPATLGLDSTGDPVMNLPWTHAGLPTLSIPAGENDAGLPLGLQLAARWYGDEQLVAWSEAIESVISG
jgi:Asp-tRNA(Asn)/Glu-tRNA(Gln) amidotransferase A subunit family amidase